MTGVDDTAAFRAQVGAALDKARSDALFFALGIVVMTPLLLLVLAFLFAIVPQFVGIGGGHDRYGSGYYEPWLVGVEAANVFVALLLVPAYRRRGRGPWFWLGLAVFAVQLVITYATPLRDDGSIGFWLLWGSMTFATFALASHSYRRRGGLDGNALDGASFVVLVPELILGAFQQIVADPWLRHRLDDETIDAAVALLQAIAANDSARAQATIDASAAHLPLLLQRAKLLELNRGHYRLGPRCPQ